MSSKEILKVRWEKMKAQKKQKISLVEEVVRELNRGISNEVIYNLDAYVN